MSAGEPVSPYVARLALLAEDVPAGPWRHRRSRADGALLIEGLDGEPVVQVYAGLPTALYLCACVPEVLLVELRGQRDP